MKKFLLPLVWLYNVAAIALLAIPTAIVLGIAAIERVADWIELHAVYNGDAAAREKDQWGR